MSELRSAILQSGQELAVETNQRALIDKVLARYSGQFTLYRELLQNADDAGASQVQITFKSAEQHPLHHPTTCPPLVGENALKMSKVEFRNDGQPFSEQDWARLRKIAEGNPDESKIGAFGVGYFSTFAVAEEPLVSSGDTAMLFFWRGDALFVRQGHNTNVDTDKTEDGKPWTTFDLTFRQPDVMPEPEHFARFLTDALVFTSRLRSIHLLLDEHILCSIHKTIAPTQSLIPARNINLRSSPIKMLQFKSIDFAPVQLTVDAMKWITQPETTRLEQVAAEAEAHSKRNILTGGASRIFSAFGFGSKPTTKAEASKSIQQNEIDLRERTQSTVFLRVVNGSISVSCPRQLSTELERATKKKPPSQTTFSMLYNSHDEHLASMGDGGRSPPEAHRLFAKLLTDLSKQGSVAIGFMTHQTTGYASSIGARFIPTVERESLDLMNAHTADWNKGLWNYINDTFQN